MGFLSMIKGWWNRMFKSEAKSEFGTTAIISGAMETAIQVLDGYLQWQTGLGRPRGQYKDN